MCPVPEYTKQGKSLLALARVMHSSGVDIRVPALVNDVAGRMETDSELVGFCKPFWKRCVCHQ